MIDVLCVDKTGTLTENSLGVGEVVPLVEGMTADDVLAHAAAASSGDGQDPVDAAIREAASKDVRSLTVLRFVPFDPAAKMSEARIAGSHGEEVRVAKGSPIAISALAPIPAKGDAELSRLGGAGFRVLAVAAGEPRTMAVIGLVGLSDPPRKDSAPLLGQLKALGIVPVMATGDTALTAATVAAQIGLDGPVCPPGKVPEKVSPQDYAVYAGVFPEDKFGLVQAFQREGHAVGMCGDGANDAPALRQAQMGIAVSTATDVAKSAAGLVLTQPGLKGIVACIEEGRAAFRRVFTFTLSTMVNKAVTLIVMGSGLVMTGHAVMTPMLQVLWMLTSDIAMMARAGDRAKPTPYPNAWRIRELTLAAIPLGAVKLAYAMSVLALGWFWLRLDVDTMRTLTFLTLVLAGQTTGLVLRERNHVWHSRPAPLMLWAIVTAAAVASFFAGFGWFMATLPFWLVIALYGTSLIFGLMLDCVKVTMLEQLPVDRRPDGSPEASAPAGTSAC